MGPGGRRLAATLLAATAIVAGGACGDDDDDGGGASTDNPVTRAELGDVAPPNAPGQHLYLQEVVIAPDTRLATHYHDGVQIGSIRSGTLTYHMLEGSVEVTRADGTRETVSAPDVIELEPGDWVIEPAEAVHFGENRDDEPVVISLAALVAADADVSTVVD